MRVAVTLALALVLSCGYTELDEDPTPDTYGAYDGNWHQAYIEDHCARCPDCCVTAEFDDEHVLLHEEDDLADRVENEDLFCTPDVCPGPCCPCVKGIGGLWWIDYTSFGTDDGDCLDHH
jgi:hypothetical protein